jgi:hypothetical protein
LCASPGWDGGGTPLLLLDDSLFLELPTQDKPNCARAQSSESRTIQNHQLFGYREHNRYGAVRDFEKANEWDFFPLS